jgi:hypothetical protein
MDEGAFGRSEAEIDLLVRGKRSGIAVVGFGYIGTVLGAVLADRGWPVTGIDVNRTVVDEINLGKTTVPEPRLNELVANNVRVGRLCAKIDFGAIADNDFVIVTVGTPFGPDFEPIVDDIKAAARAHHRLGAGQRGVPQRISGVANSSASQSNRGVRADIAVRKSGYRGIHGDDAQPVDHAHVVQRRHRWRFVEYEPCAANGSTPPRSFRYCSDSPLPAKSPSKTTASGRLPKALGFQVDGAGSGLDCRAG